MKISILRKVDRIIGVGIIRVQNVLHKKAVLPKNPKRILIIKLFGFGNFIFLSPTFKALRQIYPNTKIEILTFKQNREICSMYSEYIDQVHTIDFAVKKMGFQILAFAAKNRRAYDIIIDFEQFVRLSAMIGRLCAPKYFIGTVTNESKKEYALDKVIYYPEEQHVVEEFYEVAKWLAKESKRKIAGTPVLIPPKTVMTNVTKKLESEITGWIPVGICPGGRADDLERKYPKENFAKAMQLLLKKDKRVKLFFVGTKSERPDVDFIMDGITEKNRIVDATGLSLPESARIISKMKVFVSNDTGPLHLAASLDAHCVGLYGPSKEWIYGPYTYKKTILRDEKHKPVRSNHNEKTAGWPRKWWPTPERVASAISKAAR